MRWAPFLFLFSFVFFCFSFFYLFVLEGLGSGEVALRTLNLPCFFIICFLIFLVCLVYFLFCFVIAGWVVFLVLVSACE